LCNMKHMYTTSVSDVQVLSGAKSTRTTERVSVSSQRTVLPSMT